MRPRRSCPLAVHIADVPKLRFDFEDEEKPLQRVHCREINEASPAPGANLEFGCHGEARMRKATSDHGDTSSVCPISDGRFLDTRRDQAELWFDAECLEHPACRAERKPGHLPPLDPADDRVIEASHLAESTLAPTPGKPRLLDRQADVIEQASSGRVEVRHSRRVSEDGCPSVIRGWRRVLTRPPQSGWGAQLTTST